MTALNPTMILSIATPIFADEENEIQRGLSNQPKITPLIRSSIWELLESSNCIRPTGSRVWAWLASACHPAMHKALPHTDSLLGLTAVLKLGLLFPFYH